MHTTACYRAGVALAYSHNRCADRVGRRILRSVFLTFDRFDRIGMNRQYVTIL